ncbi:hypothetical protein DAPPUDRAFT_312548 [Daphnia pulex]|uniref:Uncharacterized protein n=1 Tax=Daphnia pulex TaxID=6669 RepID=E9FZF3_DAPPU|nr:hypothetical protein DAPPUDRAFT_312548 [Daphnia pulex]|eukprot:EFX87045.1 hypothetical protein DAPPUDRAFT_312548 [Daphnia pulex]
MESCFSLRTGYAIKYLTDSEDLKKRDIEQLPIRPNGRDLRTWLNHSETTIYSISSGTKGLQNAETEIKYLFVSTGILAQGALREDKQPKIANDGLGVDVTFDILFV